MQDIVDRLLSLQGKQSQGAFARTLGLSPQKLSDIKARRLKPAIEVLVRAAEHYQKTVDWVVRGSENRNPGAEEGGGDAESQKISKVAEEGALYNVKGGDPAQAEARIREIFREEFQAAFKTLAQRLAEPEK